MSWLTRMWGRAATSVKESAVGRVVYMQTVGRPVWTPRDYAKLAEEAYVRNAVAHRCIRMISEAASAIPFLVYDGDDELDTHPLLDVLARPNPYEGTTELLDRLYSFLLIAGNTYLEAVTLDAKLRELFVLRPDRMKMIPAANGYPAAYEYTVNNNKVRFDMTAMRGQQLPIMHLRTFHPTNDTYGLSAIEAAAFSIDVHNSAGAFNKALLDNQARPSGALVYGGQGEDAKIMSDEQFNRVKKELEEKYTGARNAGRPLLLEGGLDWKEMGITPKDLEFVEGKREAAREVALAFGVPPMLLGIPGDNTYSNYQEANRAFYRQTVLPLVKKTCEAMTVFFTPILGEARLSYDIDAIHALSSERKEVWDAVNQATFLTTNEKREAVGYEPYEPTADTKPGDLILIGAAQVPLDDTSIVGGDAAPTDPNAPPPEDDTVGEEPTGEEDDTDENAQPSGSRKK